MSLNKAMLIGNVGQDPSVRYLDGNSTNGTNTKVATFTLATTERYRDRSGVLQENTEWHNIVAWRGLADTVENFVKKGSQLYIEGHLRTRSWNDQTGQKHYVTEIVADSIQLLGRKGDRDQSGQQGGYQGQPQGGYQGQPQGGYQNQGYQPQPQPQAYQSNVPAGFTAQGPASVANEQDDLPF